MSGDCKEFERASLRSKSHQNQNPTDTRTDTKIPFVVLSRCMSGSSIREIVEKVLAFDAPRARRILEIAVETPKHPSLAVQKWIVEFAAANPRLTFKEISEALGCDYADVSYSIRRHLPERRRVCNTVLSHTSPSVPHSQFIAFYNEHPEMSYRQIGQVLGISGERVRQLAKKLGLSEHAGRRRKK